MGFEAIVERHEATKRVGGVFCRRVDVGGCVYMNVGLSVCVGGGRGVVRVCKCSPVLTGNGVEEVGGLAYKIQTKQILAHTYISTH